MDYTLRILIDSSDLKTLKGAQQNIIVAKPVGGGSPNVTWLTIDPFPDNTIEWSEAYGLYASNSTVVAGAKIYKVAYVSKADDARTYPFTASNTFDTPSTLPPVPNGTFAIANDNDNPVYPSLTFGLTQSATVGTARVDNSPISAAAVPMNQSVTLTPLTTVWVWLQSNLLSGTVITQVTSKRTIATFGSTVTSITLKYDPSKGQLVPATSSGKLTTSEGILLLNPFALDAPAVDGFGELVPSAATTNGS